MSTPYLLQDALVEEIKALFAGFETENAAGLPAPLNVYPQSLPEKTDEDDSAHFPYIVVRIKDGGIESEEEAASCRIILVAGIYDPNPNYQGNKTILNILQKIETHLLSKRIIAGKFRIEYPYNWQIYDDEDLHPYYFGGAETNWTLPAVKQEAYDDDE
ncbi:MULTISPECIES: hypothetical protein [Paenibacillus]|uniref:hypothetical protein n=1 Tax=Paenibacillus TaxID=44249 RepID=UPI0011A592FF|nr:hypothetical protein [Paenibacillus sp. IHBB 10380]